MGCCLSCCCKGVEYESYPAEEAPLLAGEEGESQAIQQNEGRRSKYNSQSTTGELAGRGNEIIEDFNRKIININAFSYKISPEEFAARDEYYKNVVAKIPAPANLPNDDEMKLPDVEDPAKVIAAPRSPKNDIDLIVNCSQAISDAYNQIAGERDIDIIRSFEEEEHE